MATYFHGNSEIQADGLQTLILMNPGYVNYSDTQQQQHQQQQQQQHQHHHQQQQHQHQPNNNFVFLNSAAAAGYSLASPHPSHNQPQQPHTQQFVGIPLPPSAVPTAASASASQDQNNHEISALHGFIPRVQYNLWNQIDPSAAAREIPRSQQGLSLSLSSHQQQPAFGSFRNEQRELPAQTQQQQQQQHTQAISPTSGGEEIRVSGGSPSSASGISNGVSGIQSVLLSSKYLKAAQILLDEVVNVVDNGIKPSTDAGKKSTSSGQSKTLIGESSATGEGSDIGGETKRSGAELTTAERQEIQMKKAKLISMLDEVEQRYRQYHLQMQIVISSFEQAAGIGSAKTYTALALQTISKQFRCLKDAILGQIRASNKSLGEEDSFGGGKMEGGSRLKFVDHQLRQQRALQQLGMIQHNAWRPQRGLPERSVSVLRAWLFEHFLHPYPKDSDKHMLAKQTGLTRSQVSNWFINARVRLWKPMVEEMYLEEIKEQEQNGSEDNNNNNNTTKSEQNDDSASKSTAGGQEKGSAIDHQKSFKSKQDNHTISTSMAANSPLGENLGNHSGFMTLIGSSELEGITVTHGSSPKKQRGAEMLQNCINMDIKPNCETNNEQISMKFGIERQDRDGYSMMGGGPANFIGGFGSYPIAEIGGRFDAEQYHQPRFSSNAVSLTLGLPDNENLSLSGTHQSFYPSQNIQLGRRLDIDESNEFGAINTPTPPHSSGAYDNMNIQNRKRFAAQLLPDFVA